jgi:transcriptional regulator with XRE-family HTH domain
MHKNQELVDKLTVIIKKDPISIRQLAVRIGIDMMALNNIWNGRTKASFKSRTLIENYIEKCMETV